MEMEQQDWDRGIEETGLETAVREWETRPTASKAIDTKWRTAAVRTMGRWATRWVEAIDGADGGGVESDEGSDDGSLIDSASEDEFAQSTESQEERNGRADAEDTTPWDRDMRAEGRDVGVTLQGLGARRRNNHVRASGAGWCGSARRVP